jgi:hypothetical protein
MEGGEISEGDEMKGGGRKDEDGLRQMRALVTASLRKIREDTANGTRNTAALLIYFIFRIIA